LCDVYDTFNYNSDAYTVLVQKAKISYYDTRIKETPLA